MTGPFMILTMIFQGFFSPLPSLVSYLIGALYALVCLAILRRTPLWPKWSTTGTWWVLAALLWGAGVSYAVAGAVGYSAVDMSMALRWEDAIASFGGAWPEEAAKALGVLFVLLSFKRFNRPWHGFVVGMIVGLGFETLENAMYGSMLGMFHPSSDMLGMLQTWGIRMVFLPFLHIAWTGAVGWAIGLALYTGEKSLGWRIRVVAIYFLYAFACHFAWNYSLDDYTLFVAKNVIVGIVMYAVWIYVWVKAWRAATSDRSYVFTHKPLRSVSEVEALDAQSPEAAVSAGG
ncbi:PrsW family glutamic-type intramembrane protease [Corynebacterium lubricantis]|uniref:PrsW family glutamic-type intramembrane protease n=1 Tax=Corynebacterium lubricantis TaxID=541095 RepID=UPI001FDFFCD1|nr:PrsW family glutamic-type intramembrane protease [Corynebacterium lubricantis]